MKDRKNLLSILLPFFLLLFTYSCTQTTKAPEPPAKIKNTLKSVSLFQDSVGIDPAKIHALLEVTNTAIDSIGYPDAGYKIWEVVTEDSLDFRFMIEGYWPDKATYDKIHDDERYKNSMKEDDPIWNGFKNVWYHRFTRVE